MYDIVYNLATLTLSNTTDCTITEYAVIFETIIRDVRQYGERQDAIAVEEYGGDIANPFADSADLCSNKLINYYQFVDNPIVLVATVLDPRGKLAVYELTSHKDVYAAKATEALNAAFAQYALTPGTGTIDESDEDERLPFAAASKENSRPSFFASLKRPSKQQQPVGEVDRYLEQELCKMLVSYYIDISLRQLDATSHNSKN